MLVVSREGSLTPEEVSAGTGMDPQDLSQSVWACLLSTLPSPGLLLSDSSPSVLLSDPSQNIRSEPQILWFTD